MSASPRPGASWLGQNYDKLALAVVLVLLLASAGLLLTKTTEAQKSSVEDPSLQPGWTGRSTTPLDITPLTNLMALLTHPLQVTAQQRRMMVGELRVASIPDGAPIAYNATKDPFSGALQPSVDFDPDSDGDGITDKIETAAGLNPSDPSDANADMDADGYTNAEEIQMKTDLRDAKVYPDPIAKLRLIRTVVNPFRFRFLSVSKLPDGDRFQLNLRSLERTYFARLGDEVEGFKVILYDEKGPEGPVLTLQQGETLIRLIQGRVINQEARSAELIFLLDGTKFRRQVGDDLKLKDLLYKVVDIKPERVVLRDERDGREAAVAPWSQEERNRLQSEPATGNPENSAPPAANPGNQEFPFQ
jgi:hypothetical protein